MLALSGATFYSRRLSRPIAFAPMMHSAARKNRYSSWIGSGQRQNRECGKRLLSSKRPERILHGHSYPLSPLRLQSWDLVLNAP